MSSGGRIGFITSMSGGIPVAEGAGFAAIMTGARVLQQDDDAMVKSIFPVLDALYATFSGPATTLD
jgi:hypothetical protein